MVLGAQNIGQYRGAAAVRDQSHRDAGARGLDGHARVEQGERAAAHRGHRGRAVRFENIRDDAQRVGELLVRRQDGLERPLGERAVPHLAPRGTANRLHFAGRERRKVVVQHERLRRFLRDVDRVDALLVPRRPQRHRHQRLRLPARKQRGAVGARQPADLAGDRPDGVEVAAVHALARRQHAVAHRLVLDLFDDRHDLAQLVGEFLGQLFDDRLLDGAERLRPLGFDCQRQRLSHRIVRQFFDARNEVSGRLGLDPLHFGLAHRVHHFVADVEQLLDALVGDFHRLDDLRLGELECPAFDHHDRFAGARHRQIEIGELELLERGIQDPRAFHPADANRRDRAVPRHPGHRQRRRRRGHAEHVGVVFLIGRQDVDEDLHFILEAFGKQRPHRAVDHARGGDLLIGRATFSL